MNLNVAGYSLLPVLPEIVLTIGAMVLLMVGAYRGLRTVCTVTALAAVFLVVTGLLVLWLPAGTLTTFGGSFIVDDYSRFQTVQALIGSVATLILSRGYLSDQASSARCRPACCSTARR